MNRSSRMTAATIAVLAVSMTCSSLASGQAVRTKRPDRGVYQPPKVEDRHAESDLVDVEAEMPGGLLQAIDAESLHLVPLDEVPTDVSFDDVQQVQYADSPISVLGEPACGCDSLACDGISCGFEPGCGLEPGCGIEVGCGFDGGCDSIGCSGCNSCRPNGTLMFAPHRWFGSLDAMAMYRKGDFLPSLVTTGSSADSATAGRLDQAETRTLIGAANVLDDVTFGGRLTIGTWLDDCQQRSLQFRGWFAAEESFGFAADESDFDVLSRPFFDVTDGITPTDEIQLVTFPGRTFGSVSVRGDSNVMGGDIAIHQPWVSGFAGAIDVLYGYQYMRLDESLSIRSIATSLDNDFAPVGAVIDIADSFDAENDFHGGQLGLSTRYQEGCWTVQGLAKVGFGSLRRSANRVGSTLTSIDGVNATDNQGLLVRDTNSGRVTDNTFGWIPELDVSLAWHRFPRFDVKLGYHVIAMSDALQVSGTIDPNLAVNLANPATGTQSPSAALRYDTFYVHGIHLGLQYAY